MEAALWQAAWQGLQVLFAWPNILYPLAGTVLAMLFSLMPGTRAVTLAALAIPLTYSWEPLHVLLLFGALVGGATFMGSVTAILMNVPGSPPNAATMIDGYPMACQGRARTALACSAAASALGSSFGIIVLIMLIPVMREAILLFGPPEMLMLVVLAFTSITVVSRGSIVKGLITAGLGLLLSFIGHDPRTGELRYVFGSLYLWDGLSFVPVFLGLFSIAEMMGLAASGRPSISGRMHHGELGGSIREGVLSPVRHFGLFLRCSVLGTVVGIIPGIGGTVASFIAYGHAAQSAGPGREKFGHGDIRGVLAPEAANDAKDGGALVPTLAFGIPGNESMALLLAALTLHGFSPGKEMMSQNLTLVFVLVWALFFSNWLTSLLGLAIVGPLTRITLLPAGKLVPVMISIAVLSAFAFKGRLADAGVALFFGGVGYFMKKHRWPRLPMVLAIVLGTMFELNFHLTVQLQAMGRITFWSRPITMILLGTIVLALAWNPVTEWRRGKSGRSC